jgi:alpha-beta hydrolase superfamily lysophospholipase
MTNIHNEFSLKTKDGLELFGQGWFPESSANKIIILIHGIGEHSTRYLHWAENFVAKRYSFFTFDLRGHGKSDGKRGHVPSLEHFLDDIEIFKAYVSEMFPGIPIVLYGHSMGGNIVLNYLLKREQEFNAAIAGSPWIKIPFTIPTMKLALAKFANTFMPGLAQPSGLIVEHVSKSKKVVEDYINDPLNHDKISARLFMDLYSSGLQMASKANQINIPLLLMHGTDDQITSAKGTEEFANNAKSNVRLKLWKDAFHELHNEPNNKEIFEDIIEWLKEV